jgi:MFS family permease
MVFVSVDGVEENPGPRSGFFIALFYFAFTQIGNREKQMRSVYYGWIIIAVLFVVNLAIQAAGMFNLGLFVIPMCSDLGISRSQFGWLSTVRALSGGVSALVLGRLVDKFGCRLLLPLSALITGICLIGIGYSTQIKYLLPLFSVIGLSGLSAGGGGVMTMVPVAKWFVRRRGLAMGIATLGVGVGAATFIPVTQFLIDGFGWRGAWNFLAGILMALIIPLSAILIRRQPEDLNLLPDGAGKEDEITPMQSSVKVEEGWSVNEAVHTRSFWLLNIALLLWGMANGGSLHRMAFWIGLGFDPRLVSMVFTIDAIGFTVMILAAGMLLDRFPPRFIQASAFVAIICAMILMLVASNVYHMLFSVILFGSAAGTTMVSQTYLWAHYYGRAFLGAIRSITLPFYLVAMAIGAPLTGFIFDHTGHYQPAWRMFIVVYFIGLLCVLAAKPPVKKPTSTVLT